MKISELLRLKGDDVVTLDSEAPVKRAVDTLVGKGIGGVVIQGADGRVVGVLSERDIVHGLSRDGAAVLDKPIREVMAAEVHTCSPDDTMFKAMSIMTDRRVRHVPILEHGELKGIISVGDAVKARIGEIEAEARALRDYINSA